LIGFRSGECWLKTVSTSNPGTSTQAVVDKEKKNMFFRQFFTALILFILPLATDASADPQVIYKDKLNRSIEVDIAKLELTKGTIVFKARGFDRASARDKAFLERAWKTVIPHVLGELEKKTAHYQGKNLQRKDHQDRQEGKVLIRTVHFLVREPSVKKLRGKNFGRDHKVFDVRGWKVYVHKSRLPPTSTKGEKAIAILDRELKQVEEIMPAKSLRVLKQIPFWINSRKTNGAVMAYHPSRRWLEDHNLNAKMAKGVEIMKLDDFIHPAFDHSQPLAVLHELAHGYHQLVLGWENAQIKMAYQKAVRSGRYDSVVAYDLEVDGMGRIVRRKKKMVRAYALTSAHEYFAELSEAYFGRNDFFPFTKVELRQHDPEGYRMMMLWGNLPKR
jgi:hypothetical protein